MGSQVTDTRPVRLTPPGGNPNYPIPTGEGRAPPMTGARAFLL